MKRNRTTPSHFVPFVLLVPLFLVSVVFSSDTVAQEAGEQLSRHDEIQRHMQSREISVDFQKRPIEEVISYLDNQVPFNLIVDERVQRTLRPEERKTTITLRGTSIDTVLKFILRRKGLGARYEEGAVVVVPERLAEKPVQRYYDVRDLRFAINDFPGPELELKDPDDQEAGASFSSDGGFLKDSFVDGTSEDDLLRDKEEFLKLIKRNTGDQTDWRPSRNVEIELNRTGKGILYVRQSKDVHREIQNLLKRLRQFR